MKSKKEIIMKAKDFAFVSLFGLCNYFAAFSFIFISKANKASLLGDENSFNKNLKYAKIISLYGLIPSTILNGAIIYYFIKWIWAYFKAVMH